MAEKTDYVTKTELARWLNVSHSTVIRWINEGKIPSIIQINNKSLIPIESIPLIKKNIGYIDTDLYMEKSEFIKLFKISDETFQNWVKKGWIKDKVEYGRKAYIPLNSLNEIKRITGFVNEDNYLTIKQLASILNISIEKIWRYINSGLINGQMYKDRYLIYSNSLMEIKNNIGYNDDYDKNHYFHPNKVKEILGVNFDFRKLKSKIPHILHLGKPYIHRKDFKIIKNLIDQLEMKKDLKLTQNHRDVPNTKKDIKLLPNNTDCLLNHSVPPVTLDGYIGATEAAEILQISKATLTSLLKNDTIKGALKISTVGKQKIWMIPKNSVEEFNKNRLSFLYKDGSGNYDITDSFTVKQVSEKLGLTASYVRQKMDLEKWFPNAYKISSTIYVPVKDFDHFYEIRSKTEKEANDYIYTNKEALKELLNYLDSNPLPPNLMETTNLYIEFCKIQFSKLRGNPKHIRTVFNYYKSVFGILTHLKKNIYEVGVKSIDWIITKLLTNEHKQRIFIQFYNYSYSAKDLSVPKKYVVSKVKKTEEQKDIYPPEVFNDYYNYVKDNKLHIPNAISNQNYANMWVFTIMHLTNVWRPSDVVYNTPHIDLDSIRVHSFEWFENNTLTITQSQKIINQLYIFFKSIKTSKTNVFVTFLVEPDLVEPLATALVISELHRQKKKNKYLLQTFIVGTKIKSVVTSGSELHHEFFNFKPTLKSFKSLKFINSTMTYLFYSITEEDDKDSDLSLELTQRVRSHNNPETTAIYVQATNNDGSLNKVSLNLFRRGHFGWLYNYLILLATEKHNVPHTMAERTSLITSLRSEIGPLETERWSRFLLQIREKRSSVISRLVKLSKESLTETLVKVFKGEMPSKIENAQCLSSPTCEYPRLNSCYSCPNIIPKNYLFIELSSEFYRLINSIETTSHEAIRKKDSYFLMHLLLLLDEGISFLGVDYINSFIQIDDVRKKLGNLAEKIFID
ncbi:helix-turn-helix domain-containing protein [Mesobacillus jeotgali]|jgi:predicted DNA-binding transcriptional regulator AlpA|uniref:helix-turn-helix domain-containing protein n=1 Tax=Mesobacillus jeotgali TaxID=129985 RepID=UPI0017876877|nr:helix-turn-helix domain-containing protein [Mesobacillus jeotgali]UYZ23292.1 helix-turn-helix domain-containing protein [Mesobacillus jeotgali]